ncbi:MAG: helix-turn-helix domain-containing protein [Pseudomonadota bacterium]
MLTNQMLITSTTWPMDMINAANQAAKRLCPEARSIELVTASPFDRESNKNGHIVLAVEQTINAINHADVIYLPALWRNPRPVIQRYRALLPWLKTHYENGAIINGVGTGCCFMAEAGLLDHKPATTHWHYFDEFQKWYPQVQLKRQYFITQAGSLYCAASINSLADLTIHFIQRFFNQAVAQHVQKHFSHEIRQAYETVSYLEDTNTRHADEDILQAQLWLQNNSGKNITLTDIAKQFDMSSRNFNRRFKAAIGCTPTQYLQELRLKTAKDLLQSSNLSVGEIADKVGYSDASHFTHLFKRSFSITPKAFRTMVRAKLFSADNEI